MSTGLLDTPLLRRASASSRVSCPLATVEVATDIAAVAARWRQLEHYGVSTPYQSLAWFTAWTQTVSPSRGETPLIIVAQDEQGRPTLLLPLVVRPWFGLRIASFAGGKHTNFNMPLLPRDVYLGPSAVEHLLTTVARLQPDLDLFLLEALPPSWEGASNPLCVPSSRAHTAVASRLDLSADPTATRSRKQRLRDRKLAQHGPVVVRRVRSKAEIERALDAFAAHKLRWFDARGVTNPFEEPGVLAFFAELAGEPRSGVEISCLHVGGVVEAVAGTIVGRHRASLMFVSYDAGSPLAVHSLGVRLLREVIQDARHRGLEVFDFGLGEAWYKTRFGAQVETSATVIRSTTLRGWFGAQVLDGQRWAKIILKKHSRLLDGLRRSSRLISYVRRALKLCE